MQTTLDLPDDLLAAVRKVADRRQTTLAAMIELSLRQLLSHEEQFPVGDEAAYEKGPYGMLSLKKRGAIVTDEVIQKLIEEVGV